MLSTNVSYNNRGKVKAVCSQLSTGHNDCFLTYSLDQRHEMNVYQGGHAHPIIDVSHSDLNVIWY
jgi:hypothetical protein